MLPHSLKAWSAIGLLLLVSLVCGGAKYTPKPLQPEQTATAFETRTLDNPQLKPFLEQALGQPLAEWPPRSWNLAMLTVAAFYYHPDLDVARARWNTTQVAIKTAGARPHLYGQITPNYTFHPNPGDNPWIINVITGFPIETAGKRRHRIEQATQLSESARWNMANSAWLVRSRLRTNFMNYLLLQNRVPILQAQLAAQQEVLAMYQRRYELGEAAETEVLTAKNTWVQTQSTLADIQRQADQAKAMIANAVGVPVASVADLTFANADLSQLPPLTDLSPAALQTEALHNRADLRGIMAEYEASQAAIRLEIAKQYPDIRIGPGYIWEQAVNFWSLPTYFVFPQYYRSKPAIPEMEARRAEVGTRFMALQELIIGDLQRNWVGYQDALRRLHASEQVVLVQNERYQDVERQFQEGEVDRIALTTAQSDRETASLARLDAMIIAQQALGLLEDTLQRPLSPGMTLPSVPEQSPRTTEGAATR